MHIDIRPHRGATTVTMRLPCQFQSLDPETGIGGGMNDRAQCRDRLGARRCHFFKLVPGQVTVAEYSGNSPQPTPTLFDTDGVVVVGGIIDLEVALNTALTAHHSTVAFGKAGDWQHKISALRGGCILVIEHHHAACLSERSIDTSLAGSTIEIIFQHHNGGSTRLLLQAAEGRLQRLTTKEGQAHAIYLLRHQEQ